MFSNRYVRFMKFVDMSGDHWLWTGGDKGEYSSFYWGLDRGQRYCRKCQNDIRKAQRLAKVEDYQ